MYACCYQCFIGALQVGAYDMYQRCNERNLRERAAIKAELAAAISA